MDIKGLFEIGARMTLIDTRFSEILDIIPKFKEHAHNQMLEVAEILSSAFRNRSKVLICGNGGSAADAQHLAAEFVNAFSRDITRYALPAIALTTDTSVLTSISNDFSFNSVFSRQIEALGNKGDVLITFTTSGTSENCLQAVEAAKAKEMTTIAFTKANAKISSNVDIAIEVPSENTQHIQENHILAYHIITELVENTIFKGEY